MGNPCRRPAKKVASSNSSVSTTNTATSQDAARIRAKFIRADEKKKDFIICAAGVIRNRFHVDELTPVDDKLVHPPNQLSDPTNFLGEIAKMDEMGKQNFWKHHHVQIIVDLCNITAVAIPATGGAEGQEVKVDIKCKGKEVTTRPTVLDQISKLGKDFFKYSVRITVDLIFPPIRNTSPAARPFGPRVFSSKDHVDFSMVINTEGFKIIQKLAAKINNCVSIKFLEVILHNPGASTSLPFTVEQLLYALPFYELRYEDWLLRWQAHYMTTSVDVGHFPIVLLVKERNKWLWAQRKAEERAEIKARKEQERIENAAFIHKSIAPQWQIIGLPEPFPPCPKSLSPKDTVHDKRRF